MRPDVLRGSQPCLPWYGDSNLPPWVLTQAEAEGREFHGPASSSDHGPSLVPENVC